MVRVAASLGHRTLPKVRLVTIWQETGRLARDERPPRATPGARGDAFLG
jgi:hypothetical protein